MMNDIYIDKRKVAELPTMNVEKFLDVLRIYLFNDAYTGWTEFKIKVREEKKETKKRKEEVKK